ncbi:MAG: hypothetical protein FWC69_05675, partial [Defluviitaleaceae bacterium]|nr:hypothetical protein [Defluviitaleaceae bacterium]
IITFLLYTAGFFKATFKALKNGDKAIKALAAALAAAMGGLLLKGMTDNIWYNFRILAFFWVIVAIGVALANVNTKENTNENQI